MAVANINLTMGCENFKYADAFGRDCKHGLMFPILALMAGYKECPNYEKKSLKQLQERYEVLNLNK